MANPILSLYDVSAKLGVSPSAIKKRVANLNLPVERGARGKLLFNPEAFALLQRADELLKAGNGFEECRRQLGLDGAPAVELPLEIEEEAIEAPAAEPVAEASEPIEPSVPEPIAPTPSDVVESVVPAKPAVTAAAELPAPIFIQLGRRKPSESVRMRMIEHQPTPTPMPLGTGASPMPSASAEAPVAAEPPAPTAPEPTPVATAPVAIDADLLTRLDAALKLIEDKDKQNHTLQSKLLVAYDEMTKLSATAAAFQERSMNLQHEVQKLQGEIRLLTAPPETKPWWKFW